MNNKASNEVTPLLLPPPTTTTTHTDEASFLHQPPPSSESLSSYRRSTSWENYVSAVEKYPIRTKCFTALIIFVSADAFAQLVEYLTSFRDDDRPNIDMFAFDWIRTMRFGALGLLGAPWSHFYFYWLDHYLPPSEEPFSTRTAVKVVIDQFIQAPILLAIMIFSLGLMKRQGFAGAKQDLSSTFMESLIANWKLWIPASFINIAFIKPSLRVLFVNVVFFFWTIILSLMLNKSTRSE